MKAMTKLLLPLLALSILFWACQKEFSDTGNKKTQTLSLYLTDDPALFDSVLINIAAVKVRVDTCSKQSDDNSTGNNDDDDSCKAWYNLNITTGFYDLLTLRNGLDTLLANGSIPAGKVEKVTLVLGTGHYLVKDAVKYPLNLVPGSKNEIKIGMKDGDWDDIGNRHRRLWLDFDVARSIIQTRNGQFVLLPFIKPFTLKKTGSIEGRVEPMEAKPVISVYNSTDTAYAIPTRDGKFKIRGLTPGTYSLFVNASNGYLDSTLTGINIVAGKETKLETIKLKK